MFGRAGRAFSSCWRRARSSTRFRNMLKRPTFCFAPFSIVAAAASRAYLPAVLDDWSQNEQEPTSFTQSYDFLDKWLSLLEESNVLTLKMLALRMLCQFATTPANAKYLVESTQFIPILETTARLSVTQASFTLQRLVLRALDTVAVSYPPFEDQLFKTNDWLKWLDQWSMSKDEKIAILTSRVMLRFASSGTIAKQMISTPNRPDTVTPSTHIRHDVYLIGILQNLLKNDQAPAEALISTCAAVATSAQSSQVFCVRVGGSALLARLKLQSEKNKENIEVQLHVSEFLKYFSEAGAAVPSSRLNSVLLTQGWMSLINSWAHSSNKDLKLNTVRVLGNLVQDDEIAIKIMAEYGVQLFLEVCSGLDIDIQHAVQDTLAVLTSPKTKNTKSKSLSADGASRSVDTSIPPLVDSPDDIVATSELSGFTLGTEDERLDDSFNVIR